MNDFAVNIAVMQGIIIEQNINYFILENQYEKELGVITEADQQNKFEAAKNWLKKKINDFIGIIKSWASAVIKFLTKTLPEWLSRQFNKLMVFLHIRQKAETIDISKVTEENRQKIKEGCRKANHANMVLQAYKAKRDENGVSQAMKDMTTIVNQAYENIKNAEEHSKELHKQAAADQAKNEQDLKKHEDNLKEAKSTVDKVCDMVDQMIEKTKNDKNTIDELKQQNEELQKMVKDLKEGKIVEPVENKKSDTILEGYMLDRVLLDKFTTAIQQFYWKIDDATSQSTANILKMQANVYGKSDDDITRRERRTIKKFGTDMNTRLDMFLDEYRNYYPSHGYIGYKKEHNLSVEAVANSLKKCKLEKKMIENEVNDYRKSFSKPFIKKESLMKNCKELISCFEKAKTIDNLNAELVKACTHIATVYLRDATALVNDSTKLQTLLINTLSNFLVNGTPVDSY